MDNQLQKYYENRFSMMANRGLHDLVEDIDEMVIALNNLSAVEDEKSLQFKKGELSILLWLKNLRQVSSNAYEELNAPNV